MKNISEIDKNFKLNTNIDLPDVRFYDVKDGHFSLHGLKTDTIYRRMPKEIADAVNEGVAGLHMHTAGGRVRFVTDSEYVALSCVLNGITRFPHMPATGVRGFDLYVDNQFYKSYQPPVDSEDCSYSNIHHFGIRKKREITINFPLYNGVEDVYLGLQQDAVIEAAKNYKIQKPVVFYGSSITQGGCASRPGLAYPAILSRELDFDYINLGFSGSARGEETMAEYIAGLCMSVFVMDYDWNAPDAEHLEKTHEAFFGIIRKKNPDLPVIIISRPDVMIYEDMLDDEKRRRDIVKKTYENAKAAGDDKVWFVDGFELWDAKERGNCTVDGCHPNDLGFVYMAETVSPVLAKALFE